METKPQVEPLREVAAVPVGLGKLVALRRVGVLRQVDP